MWRNYNEDWERRKTYLIRSLFQDIPVLSPVPEEQSSYGATSPSKRLISRPYSPLPPLIIERMPNRHDDPEEFYIDLERKMKKLYIKWFLGHEKSSFEDDYGGISDILSLDDQSEIDQRFCLKTREEGDIEEETEKSESTISEHSKSKSGNETLLQENEREARTRSDESRFSKESSNEDSQGPLIESSTQSLFSTQITIAADVHQEPSQEQEENSSSEDDTLVLSPVLQSRRIAMDNNLLTPAPYETRKTSANLNKVVDESKSCTESNVSDSTDTERDDEVLKKSSSEHSFEEASQSVELMRRQRPSSPSLGSLPRDDLPADSSQLSVTYTDIEFQTKISLENSNQEEISAQKEMANTRTITLNELSPFSSPSSNEAQRQRFSNEVNRRKRLSSAESQEFITQRKRYKNAAMQTSTEEESTIFDNWNRCKNNFFIGIPKIYRLCACDDHDCKNSS